MKKRGGLDPPHAVSSGKPALTLGPVEPLPVFVTLQGVDNTAHREPHGLTVFSFDNLAELAVVVVGGARSAIVVIIYNGRDVVLGNDVGDDAAIDDLHDCILLFCGAGSRPLLVDVLDFGNVGLHHVDGVGLGRTVQVAELVLVETNQHLAAHHGAVQVVIVEAGQQVFGVAVVGHGGKALAGLEGHPAARAEVVLGVQLEADVEAGRVEVLVEAQTVGGLGHAVVGGHHDYILLLFGRLDGRARALPWWLGIREVILRVAADGAGAAAQIGHGRAVVHAVRYFNDDAEQLEHALASIGIAEPVGHHVLVTGADALETVKVPVPAEHSLRGLQDALSLFSDERVDDDGIVVLHGITSLNVVDDLAEACAPAVVD